MTNITLYTGPGCAQCLATSRALDKKGVSYTTVDISKDQEAFSLVKELGYSSVPVVVVNSNDARKHWSGFNPDMIATL
jgi:glutaredoxin-like protein NrdH